MLSESQAGPLAKHTIELNGHALLSSVLEPGLKKSKWIGDRQSTGPLLESLAYLLYSMVLLH